MQLTDIVTAEMISDGSDPGDPAAAWARARPRTLSDLIEARPDWALWAVGQGLIRIPAELTDELAGRHAVAALCYVAARLPPDLLAELARREPAIALEHATEHLPPELCDELERKSHATD